MSTVTKEDKKLWSAIGFIILEILILIIVINEFHSSENKTEIINQVTNISIMFIFPILAVLVAVITFVHKSQTKKEKTKIAKFLAYDCIAIGLANLLATGFAYSTEEVMQYISFILQVLIFLISIFFIKNIFMDILNKFNQ